MSSRGSCARSEFRELRDRLSLWDLVERYPGRRGIRRCELRSKRLKDEPVGEQAAAWRNASLPSSAATACPLPRFNDWILVGGKRYQVDCHWPEHRQIVELDGWEGHKTRSAFREDRARDRRLGSPATRSPTSPGTNWTTNPRRSPPTYERCWER